MIIPEASNQNRNGIMSALALILFIDTMGLGLIIPILPKLISSLSDVSVGRAAEIGGLLLFTFALMQFIFAPIIGGLSDRFGRRPVLLITLFALSIDYIVMAMAPTLLWLFLGRTISGIMGATWSAANSCIADIFPPEERAANFGKLGAAGAAGLVMGPAIGGMLGSYGERIPFFVASILCMFGTLFAYFLLTETLAISKRRPFDFKRANPIGNLITMIGKPFVMGILLCVFFMHFAAQSQIAIWAFYLIEKFAWSELQIGLSVALYGILLIVVQGGLVGPAIAKFGERKTALYSLILSIPAFLIFAFAQYSWVILAGIAVGALGAFAFPAMQAMMTARIDENAQGELQGAIASIISLGSIIGPIAMAYTFGTFTKTGNTLTYFPGAPFLLSALMILVAIILFSRTYSKYYHKSK